MCGDGRQELLRQLIGEFRGRDAQGNLTPQARDAWGCVWVAALPIVDRWLASWLHENLRSDKKDILSETYSRLPAAAKSYEDGSPIAWIEGIAKNIAMEFHRKRSREDSRPITDADLVPAPESCPGLSALMKAAMDKLPPKERAALHWYADGRPGMDELSKREKNAKRRARLRGQKRFEELTFRPEFRPLRDHVVPEPKKGADEPDEA